MKTGFILILAMCFTTVFAQNARQNYEGPDHSPIGLTRNTTVFDELNYVTENPATAVVKKPFKPDLRTLFRMGFQTGVGKYRVYRFSIDYAYEYQLYPYFSLVFGTGMRYYWTYEHVLIPLFADIKTDFYLGEVPLYFSLREGYSFIATENFKPFGFLMDQVLGAGFKINAAFSLQLELGYEMNILQTERQIYDYLSVPTTVQYDAVFLNIGLSIN